MWFEREKQLKEQKSINDIKIKQIINIPIERTVYVIPTINPSEKTFKQYCFISNAEFFNILYIILKTRVITYVASILVSIKPVFSSFQPNNFFFWSPSRNLSKNTAIKRVNNIKDSIDGKYELHLISNSEKIIPIKKITK